MATDSVTTQPNQNVWRNLAYGTAGIIIAFNLAVAAPLLNTLGQGAEFFVAHDASRKEIIGLALLFVAIIPLCIATLIAASRLVRFEIYSIIVQIILITLMAIWIMGFVKNLSEVLSGSMQLLIALSGGVAIVLISNKWKHTQNFVPWLMLAPVLILANFLFLSPSSKLLFQSQNTAQLLPTSHQRIAINNSVPIFMLVFDELPVASLMTPGGEIDAANFPNFARLALNSTWYRNASTLDDHTNWAVPTMLDGVAPDRSTLPIATDHPNNLFALLASAYHISAIEPITHLCVTASCTESGTIISSSNRWKTMLTDTSIIIGHKILPESWTQHLPSITETWTNFGQTVNLLELASASPSGIEARELLLDQIRANNREAIKGDHVGEFDHFLKQIKASKDPQFVFNHVMLPHRPWNYLPSGQRYPFLAHPGRVKGRWQSNEWHLRQGYQRHMLQLALTDRLLGRFLDKLEQEGLLDTALIIIVADHGVAFELGAIERSVRKDTIGSIAAIPLFVKFPGVAEPVIDDRPATILDIVPTILDVLEASPRRLEHQGNSLLDSTSKPQARFILHKDDPLSVPIQGRDKYRIIERKYELLGIDGVIDLSRIAPRAFEPLVGRELSEFEITKTSEVTTTLGNDIGFYEKVSLEQELFPSFIDGLIEREGQSDPTVLAIAINGRVSAITETFVARRPGRWHAILPPASFREGENFLEIFEAENTGGIFTLHPIKICANLFCRALARTKKSL